jgi:adsorption protein B
VGAVRQKTRWIHGIALQSWDRMGWMGRPVDVWMALRDRRGPLVALVLGAAYALLLEAR